MMTLYALKPAFQKRLRPAVMRLARAGVTANQVTLAAMAGSVAVGALAAALRTPAAFLLVPAWLGLRMALNAADGMLARECGQASRLGACLNEIGDVVSDAALLWPFWFVPAIGPAPTAAAVAAAVLSEFAGLLGPAIGAARRYDGPMGKSDRALAFGALAAWIGLGLPAGPWLAAYVWIVVALLLVTTLNRVRRGLREADASGLPT